MRIGTGVAIAIGALLIGAAGVISIRTFVSGSRQISASPIAAVAVDASAAAERLAGAVRFETISFDDKPDASADAFLGLHEYLARQFPLVHRTLKLEKVGQYSLLYTWPGSDPSLKPIMLMAHQDVVPIAPGTEKDWLHKPFSGDIADGYVWGRGSWDDKSNLLAVLEALEMLIASGASPKRTVILASGHDEEIGGLRGAQAIAALLKSRGVELEFVLDEGSIITDGMIRGVANPVALIGLAEKGSTTLSLTAEGPPGHSSMPPKLSVIAALSSALVRLTSNQMPGKITGISHETFETLAPEMGMFSRVLLSNLWLAEPLVRTQLESQPSTNALLRTTTALTVINGGNKSNVLPGHAEALVNFRILPGDTIASVESHTRAVIADPSISVVQSGTGREPSLVSPSTSSAYRLINRTIREMMPGTIVAPGLVIAGTDSRYMSELSPNVYRFEPIRAKEEDLARFHGTNERVSIANYSEIIQFFNRLITVSGVEGR
jgi:carboxypeptidase PM20D1